MLRRRAEIESTVARPTMVAVKCRRPRRVNIVPLASGSSRFVPAQWIEMHVRRRKFDAATVLEKLCARESLRPGSPSERAI